MYREGITKLERQHNIMKRMSAWFVHGESLAEGNLIDVKQ